MNFSKLKKLSYSVLCVFLIISCKNENSTRNIQLNKISNSTSTAISTIIFYFLNHKAYVDEKISGYDYRNRKKNLSNKVGEANRIILRAAAKIEIAEKDIDKMKDSIIRRVKNQLAMQKGDILTKEVLEFSKHGLNDAISSLLSGIVNYSESEKHDSKYIFQRFSIVIDKICDGIFVNDKQKARYKSSNIKKQLKWIL